MTKLADLPKLRGSAHHIASASVMRRRIWNTCKATGESLPYSIHQIISAGYYHELWKKTPEEAVAFMRLYGQAKPRNMKSRGKAR